MSKKRRKKSLSKDDKMFAIVIAICISMCLFGVILWLCLYSHGIVILFWKYHVMPLPVHPILGFL